MRTDSYHTDALSYQLVGFINLNLVYSCDRCLEKYIGRANAQADPRLSECAKHFDFPIGTYQLFLSAESCY